MKRIYLSYCKRTINSITIKISIQITDLLKTIFN